MKAIQEHRNARKHLRHHMRMSKRNREHIREVLSGPRPLTESKTLANLKKRVGSYIIPPPPPPPLSIEELQRRIDVDKIVRENMEYIRRLKVNDIWDANE